jgi:exodeoxyribonuclease VII small subunit
MADEDPKAAFPDIAQLRYEDAREELIAIVAKLEAGQAPLEDSMHLWRRGEALAAHCSTWLDGAQAEIEGATGARENDRPDDAAD